MSPTLDPAPAVRVNLYSKTGLIVCTVMMVLLGMAGWLYDHILLLSK
jgi:hypothetical protein